MNIGAYLESKADGVKSLVKDEDGKVYEVTSQYDQYTGTKLPDHKEEVKLEQLEASKVSYEKAIKDLEAVIAEVKVLK